MTFFKRSHSIFLFLASLNFALVFSARAAITVAGYWRLGESDDSALPGRFSTGTTDLLGLDNLQVHGNISYSSDTSVSALAHTGSFISMNFANNAYANSISVTGASDNFGIEAWVKPVSTNTGQVIAYDGSTASSGFGIIIGDSGYEGLYGGVNFVGAGAVVSNTWAHVALVCSNGLSTLYVNGAIVGQAFLRPNLPSGNFAIGAPPQSPTSQFYTGLIDEVRVFTFVPGAFSTNDLLINSSLPPVSTQLATQITGTNATLVGTALPGGLSTSTWFDWGTGVGYGHTTAANAVGSGNAPVAFSNKITGLVPGQAYHFRASSSNSLGRMLSWDRCFVTPALNATGPTNYTNYLHIPFANLPVSLTGVPLAIAASDGQFGMALKADGTVAVWGRNDGDQTNVPAGLTNIIAIAAGNQHCLALKRDGTIVAWGTNGFGQTNVPTGLNNVVGIGAGGNVSMAITGDGRATAWGSNPSIPAQLTNAVSVSASLSSAAGLRADGVPFTWGFISGYPIPPAATNLVAVSSGANHVLALRADGTVLAWGGNNVGQTNIPAAATNAIAISAAGDGCLALLSNGKVVAWGSNDGGKDNVPNSVTNAVAIVAAGLQNYAMNVNGSIIGFGDNQFGELNITPGLTNIGGAVAVNGSVNTNLSGLYIVTLSTTNFFDAINSTNATVTITSPGIASSVISNGQFVVLSWPAAATGYTLQRNPTLARGTWTNAPSGANNPATIAASSGTNFFRLVHP